MAQFPPVFFAPTSTWAVPHHFPEVLLGEALAIDTETSDPGLKQRGPGSRRGEGYVAGISLATAGWEIYLPFRHPENNLSRGVVIPYVIDCIKRAGRLIFANAPYDLGWLDFEGIDVVSFGKEIYDIQIGEALLDEEAPSYSLDNIALRRLGVGKDETLLREAADAYGVGAKGGLAMLPARFVGRYAEMDARRTLDVALKQEPLLADYRRVLALENKVLPLVFRMHKLGIPVDLDGGKKLSIAMELEEMGMRKQGREEHGCEINEWSGAQIAKVADSYKIQYPRTESGNPSFTSDYLSHADHPFLKLVNDLRDINKHRSTYVNDWLFNNAIKGRIHPQWHQISSDEGGTKTGRMSCSNPNAQQVPKKSKWGAEIRKLFVPDGNLLWAKLDYSQQEPRILAHYGMLDKLRGADKVAEAYRHDAHADIYQILSKAAGVTRTVAKTLTLGSIYGMGMDKLADKLEISRAQAENLRATFDKEVPFVRELAQRVSFRAELRGVIRTLGGRARHFDTWEPARSDKKVHPLRKQDALRAYGKGIRRANTYRALNSLIQGSAADMTKMAMVNIYESLGLVPYMQVHDELNYGVTDEKQALQIKECMEHAYQLEVPILAELEVGRSWK